LIPEKKLVWINHIFHLMKNLYDRYIFSPFTDRRIYNPTLVMYLLERIDQLDGGLMKVFFTIKINKVVLV